MAQQYSTPAMRGTESFLFNFIDVPDAIDYALDQAVVQEGSPEPSSLMDLVLLWLVSASQRPDELNAYWESTSFELYLQTVLILADMWVRTPERFQLPDSIINQYRLEPIAQLFPALPSEDQVATPARASVDRRGEVRGEIYAGVLLSHYDHPALRRDVYEHYMQLSERVSSRRARAKQ